MRPHPASVVLVTLLAVACAVGSGGTTDPEQAVSDRPTATAEDLAPVTDPTAGAGTGDATGRTSAVGPAGNVVDGTLDLSGTPLVVDLGVEPVRVVTRVVAGGLLVDVEDVDGRVTALLVGSDDTVAAVPAGTRAAPGDDDTTPRVTADGDLRLASGDVVDGPFLPDADAVVLDDGRVVVLADPTEEYGHAVLGDGVEAGSVAVVDSTTGEVTSLRPERGRVVEQRRVHATALDGVPAFVVTTSGPDDGARVELWTADGERRLLGPAIGTGNRWRHVVGVSTTADGTVEVVEVVTPHLARIASLLQVDGDRLVQVAAVPDAVASHAIGSRELAQAAVVDVDGDGRRDLVGPAADGDGIAWVVAGEDTPNQSDAGLVVATNMAVVALPDGRVAMAYGSTDGRLVVRR